MTFLSYRRWKSRQQRARLQNGSTFVVAVFCCIHGFHSSSNPLWYRKGRLKFKYFTNRLKLDSSNTFKMEQRRLTSINRISGDFQTVPYNQKKTKSAQPLLNNCRGQVYDMQWIWWVKLKPVWFRYSLTNFLTSFLYMEPTWYPKNSRLKCLYYRLTFKNFCTLQRFLPDPGQRIDARNAILRKLFGKG